MARRNVMARAAWTWAITTLAALFVLAPPALANCVIAKVATLPITMVGTRPMTPVRINGVEVRLLADSGAFYSVIDYAKSAELKLDREPLPFGATINGVAGAANAYLTRVRTLDIAGVTLPRVQFVVASLAGDQTASGLLGQNFLGLFDVEYDFQDGAVTLWKPAGCGGADMAYWAKTAPVTVVPIESLEEGRHHTIGEASLNGHRVRVMFDTGAASTVVSRSAAAAAGVRIDSPGVREEGRGGGVGGATMRDWVGHFANFKIGDEEVRGVDLRIGEMRGLDVDMILGSDYFISHRIFVANSQRRLFITYLGGPVFGARLKYRQRDTVTQAEHDAAAPTDGDADPVDADGFGRRGASRLTRLDAAGALADLDKAVAMAPGEPRYLVMRARAHDMAHEPALAAADLDKALALKSDDLDALLARATRRGARNVKGALEDLDAADRVASREESARLEMGDLYIRLGRAATAVGEFDQWIASHPDHAALASALGGRCRARALANIDLDLALKDCNRSISLSPGTAPLLASRGLARLRRGELTLASADFAAALAVRPDAPMARLGRGLVEARQGAAAEAAADFAAATRDRTIAELARAYGLEPPAQTAPPAGRDTAPSHP